MEFNEISTISDGSGGESYTVGHAESESEVETAGKPGKNLKNRNFKILKDRCFFVFMDWTISDGSGGESYTVGRAESESEVEIAGKPQENQIFRDDLFKETDFLTTIEFSVSRHAQLAIYTVFDEESESEVKKCQILEPGGKI